MQFDIDIGKIFYSIGIYIFIALFIGISQAAGIGGGPILNISLMLGLGYQAKQAMAITYLFLLGGSIASIYSNYGKKVKNSSKNAINEQLITLTLPMTVAGSIFGVFIQNIQTIFNHFISQFIITVAFTVLLSYLAKSSWIKYQASKQISIDNKSLEIQLQQNVEQQITQKRQKLQKIINYQAIPLRKQNIIIFFEIIIFSIIILLLKGGSNSQSIVGFTKCGTATWIMVFLHLILSFWFGRKIAYKLNLRQMKKQYFGYQFKQYQFKASTSFNQAMLLGFAGGFIGGVLGIGGAIILVPAWLDWGIDKDVASSSSAPLILASALISSFIGMLCGFYNSIILVAFHLCWAFMASFYIKNAIVVIKNKYKLQGIIFLLLVILMVMSLIFLLPFSLSKMFDDPEQFFQFGHLC